MAGKKTANTLLIGVAVAVVVVFLMILLSDNDEKYHAVRTLPEYEKNSKPSDGDTQADTIKALQAYAQEAVGRAKSLNEQTRQQARTVLETSNRVERLESENNALRESAEKLATESLETENRIRSLEADLLALKAEQANKLLDEQGIPVGFGFDHLATKPLRETGNWHEPVDREPTTDERSKSDSFAGLLAPPGTGKQPNTTQKNIRPREEKPQKPKIEAVYTLPKDSVLFDGIALTALVGRIPVEGTTPDPYPVKILVGKENLAANGHRLPDVDGMIFSGIGIGDWNLSCVSVRLTSATYIFNDGTLVNHTSDAKPLGYLSDRQGWPCIGGTFRTNAPTFLRDRIGLAGLSAAGSAYANAQLSTERSGLTGNAVSALEGNIDKLVAGTVVQSATDEVSQWLLERQKQSFDAVVVEPGAAVSIHLEQTLAIDHHELARRTHYTGNIQARQHTLD